MRSSAGAEEYIAEDRRDGRGAGAIEHGYMQGEIQEAAYRYQQAVESNGEEIVVGVNAFQMEEHLEMERLKVDPAIEEAQRPPGKPCARARDDVQSQRAAEPAWRAPPAETRT